MMNRSRGRSSEGQDDPWNWKDTYIARRMTAGGMEWMRRGSIVAVLSRDSTGISSLHDTTEAKSESWLTLCNE
jgi:hypothetical protein